MRYPWARSRAVAMGVDVQADSLDLVLLSPLSQQPSLATSNLKHVQAVRDFTILGNKVELFWRDRILDLRISSADGPVFGSVHDTPSLIFHSKARTFAAFSNSRNGSASSRPSNKSQLSGKSTFTRGHWPA